MKTAELIKNMVFWLGVIAYPYVLIKVFGFGFVAAILLGVWFSIIFVIIMSLVFSMLD